PWGGAWGRSGSTAASAERRGSGPDRDPAGLVAQRFRDERRQRGCALVDVGAVVLRREGLAAGIGFAEIEAPGLARQGAAPPAGRVARLRERQGLERGEPGLAHLAAHLLDQVQQYQRRLGLLHQDAVVLQRAEAAFVEGLVEQ